MRWFAVVFLSCIPLAAQGGVGVAGVGIPGQGGPISQASPTSPQDLCTLEGTVTNAMTGGPVKKASVVLNRTDLPSGLNVLPTSYSTSTDAAGKFAMKDLEPGKYRMTVQRNGFVTMSYGARSPTSPGTTVALARGQKMTEVNFRLTPHGVVTGRILDEDGDPMPNVPVNLVRFQTRRGSQQVNMAGGSGSTNDLGEYRIFGVPPGKYYLRAQGRPGMGGVMAMNAQDRSQNAQPEEDYVATYFPGTIDPTTATPIEVASGSTVSGIDFTLSKTRTVHVSGVITNVPAGRGRQTQVFLLPRNGTLVGGLRPSFTDPSGKFDIRGVTPGQYTLSAQFNDGAQSLSGSLQVDVGTANLENINLELSPGVKVSGSVKVEGDTTQSLTNVQVMLRPRNSQGIVLGGSAPGRLKDDRSFQIDNVAPNLLNVSLFGLPDGFYVKSVYSGQTDVLANGLDVSRGAPQALEIVLSPNAGTVSGTVQNSKTGQATPGAMVVLVPQEKARQEQNEYYKAITTDQNGTYTLKNVTPGEYKAFAWEEVEPGAYFDPDFVKPFEGLAESVTVHQSDRQAVTLKLIPAGGQAAPKN